MRIAAFLFMTLAAASAEELKTLHGQPSFLLSTAQTELAVTQLGGHMAPVTFYRDSPQPVRPYHISPWQDEAPSEMPAPVLVPLRGDFFCMPFGGNNKEFAGEKHPPHGEIVGQPWRLVRAAKSGEVATLVMEFETKLRPGRVTKELSLVEGQNVIYCKHTIEGFAGPVPLGHHATLAMPDKEGSVRISSSPFRFGMTCPGLFSDPKKAEYQALLPGQKWTDLAKVPLAWKNEAEADLTRLPARQGYADLIQIFSEPWEQTEGPAWICATFAEQGYVWFALKDPAVLASTVFWMENRGRHGHPWRGRNNCLGLEDVTAYFAEGLAASAGDNLPKKEGVPTTLELRADKPTVVNYIQGVAKIPAGFDQVRKLEFAPGRVSLVSTNGQHVEMPLRHEFLRTGRL